MCEKCAQIDKRIAHYTTLVHRITDQPTVERIEALIEQMLVEKASLHPEPKPGGETE